MRESKKVKNEMSALRKKIFEPKGEGILKLQNTDSRPIEIPVTFTCAQHFDGAIDGTITLIEENHTQYMELFHLTRKGTKFCLSANLDGGELNIEPLFISELTPQSITFSADCLKLKHREISSASNKIFCKFNVPNFKSINTIKDGKITFSNYTDDIGEDIEIYKKSDIMGVVQIELNDDVRLQSIEAYKSLLFKKIDKILRLVSLFQDTLIDWAYFELYEQNNEGEYKVYSEGRNIRSAFSARDELTSYGDLSNYIKKTYPNYTDNLDTDLGFNFAVEWYLESLNRGLLESKYLRLYVVLETFIYRFATIQKKECRKALSIDTDKDKRRALCSKLECLNRSFKDKLTMFLGHYKIGYGDIIEEFGELIKIRDNITHRGISEKEFEDLIEAYDKLMALVRRIFLAILKYEGSYRNLNKKLEVFKKDQNDDWRKKVL